MVVENLGLIYTALRKWGVPFDLHEECASDFGYSVMLRCARSFDPLRGAFSTLVINAMGWQITNWRVKRRRRASLATFVSADKMHENGWNPPVDDDLRRQFEARQTTTALLCNLDQQHRMAVMLRYIEGGTLEQVGLAMGVCKERARQVINEGLAAMRGMAG